MFIDCVGVDGFILVCVVSDRVGLIVVLWCFGGRLRARFGAGLRCLLVGMLVFGFGVCLFMVVSVFVGFRFDYAYYCGVVSCVLIALW